ncbi:8-oxo-dGTP pyrophosphatase MutT (NUDIX family) [Rhizomicrobium palustre]|uniref:8-oxo-dGTP pyrophosphatase MutT (NUDIX family) n=1 Tax=Rhizomicrobium palustre TaxID=189966 RepID=A0A846MWI8_9PROT|nr:8-oxo-dGTP pyrophosphatase MutT (NUDIX family) [Rhizomicrobium palustre]
MEVLLITSRETKRWIIPKGNIGKGKTALQAAEQEAWEETGVRGHFHSDVPLGFYMYFKVREDHSQTPMSVEVYMLHAESQAKKWPEKGERKLRWLPVADAIKKIEEPGVEPLLKRVAEMEDVLARAAVV